MTTKTKRVLFDVAIAGVTIFTVYKVSKKLETKYTNVSTPDHPTSDEEADEEVTNEVSKVKEKIQEASIKIVNWITAHREGIDAFTSCFSLAASIYTLKGAIKKSSSSKISSNNSNEQFNKDRKEIVQSLETAQFDIKPGDTVIGEWSNNNALHFTVV